jgi:hypothetical protein
MPFNPEKFVPQEMPPEQPDSVSETESAVRVPDFAAELQREVESAQKGIAQAVWSEPANFAKTASRESAGDLSRFLEKFAALDDQTLVTDELKKARDSARAAVEPK